MSTLIGEPPEPTSYEISRSPVVRQAMFELPLFHVCASWLSSKVLNVLPVAAWRVNARSRNVFGGPETFGDEVLHAARRLSLLGVTPPAFELIPHEPGWVSLSPPSNMESTALLSIVVGMLPASACQSMSLTPSGGVDTSPAGLSWLPSAPWKLLPASGAFVGVSASADELPATSREMAQRAPRARRGQWFM